MKEKIIRVVKYLGFMGIMAILLIIILFATCIKSIFNIKTNENVVKVLNVNTAETQIVTDPDPIIDYKIAYKQPNSSAYNGRINIYTDILNRMDITEMDVNTVLSCYIQYNGNENSIFKNKGAMFCDISNLTGLDVLFIIMAAANAYGWNYSIDDVELIDYKDPNRQFESNILSMAELIKNSYYIDKNCHTLNDMVSIDDAYAIDNNWATSIASAMDEAYKMIADQKTTKTKIIEII